MWNWKTCIFAGSSRQFPSLSYPCPVLQRGHASFHISWTLLGSSSCSWSSGWFSCDPAPVPPAVLSWCWCRGRREPVGFRPDFRCGGGFPWTFFFFKTLRPCTFRSLSRGAWDPRTGCVLCGNACVLTRSVGRPALSGSPSFLLQLPHLEKEGDSSGIQCLLEWAALPSQNFQCGV